MTYRIELSKPASKYLKNISKDDLRKIQKKIDELTTNPRPNGYKKLEGETNLYRIRSGDYRILYRTFDRQLLIIIIDIGHRKFIYS